MTVEILMEDKPGVLMRALGIVTAKGCNITSLPRNFFVTFNLGTKWSPVRSKKFGGPQAQAQEPPHISSLIASPPG